MSDKPINLQFNNFRGLWSDDDSGLIPSSPETGVYAQAIQNTVCEDGTITFAQGYEEENDGSSVTTHANSADNTYIRNEWRLEKRNGVKIMVCQLNNGKLEWLNTVLNRYETLLTGLTTSVDVGCAEFNKTSEDKWYFGDGVNNLSSWTKAISYYASDNGADEITVTVPSPATSLATAGFTAAGTVILTDGTTIAYTGLTGLTFTGCASVPTAPVVGDGIAEIPDTTTLATQPKGRIFFVYQGRLGIVTHADTTLIRLSVVADGTDFTTTGTSGTITINLIDGNGVIQHVAIYDKNMIVYKRDGIIPVKIEQIDSTTLKTIIDPLILYPDVGPSAFGQVVPSVDEVFHISAEKDIKRLTTVKAEEGSTSKALPITDNVKKTMDALTISPGRGIFSDKSLLFSAKSASDIVNADTIIHYDYGKETFYFHKRPAYSFWKDPDGILHHTSPTQVKSYRLFSGLDADGSSITYLWKTGRLNMGSDFYKNEFNLFAVFGKMTKSSILTTRIDYNSGALGGIEWDINGDGSSITNGKYILGTIPGGIYGQNKYGIIPYGGPTDNEQGYQYFLFFKSMPKNFRPYDVVVEFSAEGESNNIKILGFGLNPQLRPEISKYRRA